MKEAKYIPGDLIKIQPTTNWFCKEDPVLIVRECDKDSVKVALNKYKPADTGFKLEYLVYVSDIIPIPLTIEILEKNGWKLLKYHERNSYDDVSWSSYHKPAETNISLRFYPEEEAFFLFLYAQEISETPIRYIHQLQHILFGLGLNSEMEV